MRERYLNILVLALLAAVPLWAYVSDEPFTITLSTKVAILALAGVWLNFALGLGGLVSLGYAMFFSIGGYAMGILASHAQSYMALLHGYGYGSSLSLPLPVQLVKRRARTWRGQVQSFC